MSNIRMRGLKMAEDNMLERTNRVNTLFDFYGSLLTDKQQSILSLYYQDNYSLGEIASELAISRQAVFEHLKRAEQVMEDYEFKLQLSVQFARRAELAEQLERLIRQRQVEGQQEMLKLLTELQTIDSNVAE
jgi:uncharacterized protein